jgi:hypothetical protein
VVGAGKRDLKVVFIPKKVCSCSNCSPHFGAGEDHIYGRHTVVRYLMEVDNDHPGNLIIK